jgi:hypothetical protein
MRSWSHLDTDIILNISVRWEQTCVANAVSCIIDRLLSMKFMRV